MADTNETVIQQVFHDEGKNIFIKMLFKNGVPHGESITSNKEGEVIQKVNFIEGKVHGNFLLFDKKKMKARMHYKEDKLDGRAEYFDDQEKVIGIENFKNGKKHGLTEWKDNNGNLLYKENYHEGLLHGEKEEFYPSGKLKRKTHYYRDKIIGEPEEFKETEKGTGESVEKKSPLQFNVIVNTAKKFLLAKLGFE